MFLRGGNTQSQLREQNVVAVSTTESRLLIMKEMFPVGGLKWGNTKEHLDVK